MMVLILQEENLQVALDTRYKRASAMAMIVPCLHTVHTDTTGVVSDEERWAATWMYSGITISGAGAVDLGIYYYTLLMGG